ncbi:MAG TPA: DUF4388 domain-containing protein, partial [Thermoanaerobaculia bacterium]|nr:DUF4388 domain-containing protein [Thermoanaerobaculia bacterium]
MGLEGTLRVFSLTDIFQVLGLQRKSGLLTVEGEQDTVTIAFLGGQVVSADSTARRLDNRIGNLLVRAGRVSQEQLGRVLRLQQETQQRVGILLIRERLVTPQDLREALRLQVCRIVFGAFRWQDGRFRFSQDAAVEYDADHMLPMSTESILMEAAQMHDEWPRLEKKIRSRETVYRRAPGVEKLVLSASPGEQREGTLVVSKAEAETWGLLDGTRSVVELLDRAFLSDFELYKGLSELIDRNLIVEGRLPPPAPVAAASVQRPRGALRLWIAFALFCAVAIYAARRNPSRALLSSPARMPGAAEFLKSVSLARLTEIERAVRVYYDSTGQYPRKLEDLIVSRILPESAV